MKRRRVVIIGTGLGGCVAADALAGAFDVTVVEQDSLPEMVDAGAPAITEPHAGAGLGGTTRWWHNGLIEVPAGTLGEWPVPTGALEPYIGRAYEILGGVDAADVRAAAAGLRELYAAAGIPSGMLGNSLFYPRKRRNLWQTLRLDGRVTVVRGRARPLAAEGKKVALVTVDTAAGTVELAADMVIAAAGGLGTPPLLARISDQAGRFYEDHPFAFVAEVRLNARLYKLWNHAVRSLDGTMRIPLVVDSPAGPVSFQLRPAVHMWSKTRRERVTSALNDLRNRPFRPATWWKLLRSADDALDILSFKFGIRVPTDRYTLMMVASQPGGDHVGVATDRQGRIVRDWRLDQGYLEALDRAIDAALAKLGPLVREARVFPGWRADLQSSAHHSGTARMAATAGDGVCDADGRVFGVHNLFVADGSLIPASGYANTGLTIAALALRLADNLKGGL